MLMKVSRLLWAIAVLSSAVALLWAIYTSFLEGLTQGRIILGMLSVILILCGAIYLFSTRELTR